MTADNETAATEAEAPVLLPEDLSGPAAGRDPAAGSASADGPESQPEALAPDESPGEGQPSGNEPASKPGTCIGCSHSPHCLRCTRPASQEQMYDAGNGYLYCEDTDGCEQRWAEIVKAIRRADMAKAAAEAQPEAAQVTA